MGLDWGVLEILYARVPRFERFFRIKTTAAFVAGRQRILTTLRKAVSEQYVDFGKTYPTIQKRVVNYHIGNYLGIQPENLSRIRRNLELSS